KAADIYRAIEQAASTGSLAAGAQLPTVRALADALGVNKNTIAAAYKALLENGVILTDGRRGSVVARRHHERPTFGPPHLLANDIVALHDGNPDPAFLPTRPELLAAFTALDLVPPRLYGEAHNVPALLEWAHAAFAADGLLGAGIFVSGGALDALERALRAQLKPGDKVAVEDPGYFTVLALVRSLGLRPVPLASDADGIRPASLAAALAGGCRAVVFSTRVQNPTGAVTTALRAQALRPLAQQHPEVLFLDDDHSSMLKLASYESWHGEAARWLTIRSFSKFLGPDLRVAVSTGDAATLSKLDYAQATSMGWISSLLQSLVVQLLHNLQVCERIEVAGAAYRTRFAYLQAGLAALGLPAPGRAGLNLWLPLPEATTVVQGLLAKGWLVRPGTDFSLQNLPGIRLTTARLQPEQAEQLLAALRELRTPSNRTSLA
ncbi:MAG: aminotransferase class I/II-fold pyridoxal phosphate-dependent enzyme, partial [Janthinobacterium lividum]